MNDRVIDMTDKAIDLNDRAVDLTDREINMAAAESGRTGIKICGLSRPCDIEYVNEAMPDYAGFILHFPRSRRNIDPLKARELIRELRPGIKAVGVFVDQPLDTICDTARTAGLHIIQLHGSEDNDFIREAREKTGLPVWKAFRIRTAEDIRTAAECAADMILLDNGYGTGEAFDWSIVTGGQSVLRRDFILAGGLTPETILDAVRAMQPLAVDLSSGVETDKLKDRDKIIAAVKAARCCDH